MTVYLIHFEEPYKHARHYVGFAENLRKRLTLHALGHGARLMEVVKDAGITWRLARTWRGNRQLERKIKNRKHAPLLCPFCSGQSAMRRANYSEEI
jgi:hypothetical protein